jgi:hypothetical protein
VPHPCEARVRCNSLEYHPLLPREPSPARVPHPCEARVGCNSLECPRFCRMSHPPPGCPILAKQGWDVIRWHRHPLLPHGPSPARVPHPCEARVGCNSLASPRTHCVTSSEARFGGSRGLQAPEFRSGNEGASALGCSNLHHAGCPILRSRTFPSFPPAPVKPFCAKSLKQSAIETTSSLVQSACAECLPAHTTS